MSTCSTKQQGLDIEDYVRLSKEMNESNGLQGYLVVYQKADVEGRIEICKEVLVVPSFSHVAALLDKPENGVAILDVKYVGVGKAMFLGLAQKPVLSKESEHGNTRGV